MARLMWNVVGERVFEAGVDRGVLYVDNQEGVPWNGLVSVAESLTGGDITPYYVDGIKYRNDVATEEFEATIEAFTYPDEFSQCEGTEHLRNGLFATLQPKKSFGLAYRTKVGNDINGVDHAYKIHLIYNAKTAAADRPNNTVSETIEPFNFSWQIVTRAPLHKRYNKPTSHFVIDSRETPPSLLSQIEDILYGSVDSTPRLPSVSELLFIFEEHQTTIFDAGTLGDEYFASFDAGVIPELQTSTLDGGAP